MSDKANENYDEMLGMLEEVQDSWSKIIYDDDGEEYSYPGSEEEVIESRERLREIYDMGIPEGLEDYYNSLMNVLDGYEDPENTDFNAPSYARKRIIALIVSLLFLTGLIYILSYDQYSKTEFSYEQEWFVTERSGWLVWDAFLDDKELKETDQKIYLKKGTKLTPIAEIGNWVQVETENGHIGLVDFEILKGSRYIYSKKDAMLSKTAGGNTTDTLLKGTQAYIIERKNIKGRYGDELFLKIKLDDGKTRWAKEYEFKYEMFDFLPEIEQLFIHTTNVEKAREQIIGKNIDEIESVYGPALSNLKLKNSHKAFFRHLIIADTGRMHYKKILVNFNNDTATSFEYLGKGEKRTYDVFPLVGFARNFEINQFDRSTYYEKESPFEWWDNWKRSNWITRIISWVVWVIVLISIFIIFFSTPWIIMKPLFHVFMFWRKVDNATVVSINSTLFLLATYAFTLISINMLDQWVIPVAGSFGMFFLYVVRHARNISYNRCPMCHTMYSALDRGTTHTGRKVSTSWGTYDTYKGDTISYRGTTKVTTKNYERRDKKTTTTTDSYLDHRECGICGYDWDIDVEVTSEKTKHY